MRHSSSVVDSETVSRIVSLLQTHTRGVTIHEIIEELKVSRLTALRWMTLMEEHGLVLKAQVMEGRRGRPKILYHLADKPIKSGGKGTFVLTGIGKRRDQSRFHVLEKILDFPEINESIIKLDETIFASSVIDLTGNLKTRTVRHGYENRLSLDKLAMENWGSWVAIIVALTSQQDKFLSETEYVTVRRKEFNSLIIPFNKLGLIVNLTIEKTAESTSVAEKVTTLFNRLTYA